MALERSIMDQGAESYRRFLGGADEGIVEIIRDYKDGLIFYLRTFTTDILLAEELAEDTFVKLATKRPHYNGKASFKTWLYTIGRNVAIDELRRRARHGYVPLEEAPEITDEEADLEATYLREERQRTVRHAIDKLSESERQVIYLVYFEDMSMKEAAAVLGKNAHSTETLCYRARKHLKDVLEKEGFAYEKL